MLRMPADRMVRFALMALGVDSSQYPAVTARASGRRQLVAMASNRVNVARHGGVGIVNMRVFFKLFSF